MKHLIGQMKAKRGLAAALIHPYLDRVCISGSGGVGKTTLLESIFSYYPKEDVVIIPSHVATQKLLGAKELYLFTGEERNPRHYSIIDQKKVVVTDNFALMPKRNQRLLVQLLKNKEWQSDQQEDLSSEPNHVKWFYCLDQQAQDKSMFKHAKLCVHLEPIVNVAGRSAILAATNDDTAHEYTNEELNAAKRRLPWIHVSGEMLQLAIEVVMTSGCRNQEADIDVIETARALAALDAEESVERKHIEEAAVYAVSHRMGERQETSESRKEEPSQTEEPEAEENQAEGQSDPSTEQETADPDHDDRPDNDSQSMERPEEPSSNENTPEEQPVEESAEEEVEQIMNALQVQSDFLFLKRNLAPRSISGKRREKAAGDGYGRMVRAVSRQTGSVSFYHTLTAAAPYKKVRIPRKGLLLAIEKEDLRYQLKEKQQGFTILFLVDASRSIAARKQMRVVKGAIMELLQQSYQKRDRIGLATFRKSDAKLVLPFTNKFAEAKQKLGELPTGGKTPLAAGLQKAFSICIKEKRMHQQETPYIVMLTDGNANETITPGGTAQQARQEAYQIADKMKREQIPVTVIDTQSGSNTFGLAEALAVAIGGDYVSLKALTDQNIANTVRNRLGPIDENR